MSAWLIAAAFAAADEPGRGHRREVTTTPGATAHETRPVRAQQAPILRPSPEPTPSPSARSAGWGDATDGSAGRSSLRVTPVSGAEVVHADARPNVSRRDADPATDGVMPAKFNVPAAEPLSRFTLPESSSEFDPGQTLRDWAEGAGLILAFVVVSLWLLRQWITRRDLPGGAMSHLRTIESLALPQRCRVHLVEVDGRQVLVAADAAGIKSVTVLPDRFGPLLDATDEEVSAGARAPADFPEPARVVAWHGLQESRPA